MSIWEQIKDAPWCMLATIFVLCISIGSCTMMASFGESAGHSFGQSMADKSTIKLQVAQ